MHKLKLVLFSVGLFVSASATSQLATTTEAPVIEAGDGQAIVYFVRTAGVGRAVRFWAFVDDELIGVTRGKAYVGAAVAAGERVVWSRSGNVSSLRIRLDPGRTYFFEQKMRMGALKGRVRLEPTPFASSATGSSLPMVPSAVPRSWPGITQRRSSRRKPPQPPNSP